MRRILAPVAVVIAAVLLMRAGHPRESVPLWPGARYTRQDRDRAIRRGLEFIYTQVATQPKYFYDWGHDLLTAFYNIAATSSDRELSRIAWNMGHERAREWLRLNRKLPDQLDSVWFTDLVFGMDSAERLGVSDPELRRKLTEAAAHFSAQDLWLFDPVVEAPPADIPRLCRKCGRQNVRGAKVCSHCNAPLQMRGRYDVFMDALITSYTGDIAGIRLGAPYAAVLKWAPAMRPYPSLGPTNEDEYYEGVYAATHLIYTYNHYSKFRVSSDCFPQEYQYLKSNLRIAAEQKDAETMGEYLDSLRVRNDPGRSAHPCRFRLPALLTEPGRQLGRPERPGSLRPLSPHMDGY